MKRIYLIAAVTLFASSLIVNAQDAAKPRNGGGGGGGNPLFAALDTNKDGVLDADEIANAPAALKKLDKNGDGKLTREELRPAGAGKGQNGERPRRNKPATSETK